MAHLQPPLSARAESPPRKLRLTSIRGFMGDTAKLTGEQVRDIWAARFRERGPAHPFWLYTHVPFCPQICSFCQCSTSLRKSDDQVERYLDWLEGEIDFFAAASEPGVVRFQYIGGGTPNLLSEPQLERLLGTLNRRFRFETGSRRTFEFLPSSLRSDTLPLARAFGFNRLSCGVQSWSAETLKAVNRSKAGLEELGRTIRSAYDLGYDELNLDLIHGIGEESEERFLDGLLRVLALGPTTVTVHNVIPTPTNPVFASVEDELEAHAAFERLEQRLGEAVAARYPDVAWVLRPNSWILVDRRFQQGPSFSPWYYSDNERIHIDMLSLGRFAQSNVLGEISYENLSYAERYDPREASYSAFRKSPAVDAALDLITDLVGDRRSDLAPIRHRHGAAAVRRLEPVLEQLRRAGCVAGADDAWEPVRTDGVFVDPFWPILEAAMQDLGAPSTPLGKDVERAIAIAEGGRTLFVFVEKIDPAKRYFAEIGKLGLYYRAPEPEKRTSEDDRWAASVMEGFVAEARRLLGESPTTSAKQALARLKLHRAAQARPPGVSR